MSLRSLRIVPTLSFPITPIIPITPIRPISPIKKSESNIELLSLFDFIPSKSSTEATTKQPPTTILNRNGSATQKSRRIRGIWGFVQRGRPQASQTLFYLTPQPKKVVELREF